MIFDWPDLIGFIGVFLVLFAYFLLQNQKVSFDDYSYLSLNAVGAALLLISLVFKFNPASFLIECCWLGISLYGFVRKWMFAREANQETSGGIE